jgi:CshA-type fibril repeat protein
MTDDVSNTGVALQRSLLRLIDPVSGEPVLTVTTEDGTFTANSNGTITFVPAEGFIGTADPVVYQITDSLGQNDTASYTPTVEEPLESEARPDTTIGYLGAPQTVDLLDNDIADPVIGFNEDSVRLCDVTASPAEVAPNCTALSVTIPGVGNYTLTEAGLLTFTPEPDYLGTPEPLPYIVIDNFEVLVSSTYTPTVLMPPPPTAVPDRSVGPFNQSQFANVVANDSPGAGAELDAEHLLMYNPDTDTWGTDPVETLDGVYTIEAASGVELLRARTNGATVYGPTFSVAVDPSYLAPEPKPDIHQLLPSPSSRLWTSLETLPVVSAKTSDAPAKPVGSKVAIFLVDALKKIGTGPERLGEPVSVPSVLQRTELEAPETTFSVVPLPRYTPPPRKDGMFRFNVLPEWPEWKK